MDFNHPKGIALSVAASTLFGLMVYCTVFLQPLNGLEVYAWRMIVSVPLVTLLMFALGEWPVVWAVLARLRHEPLLWLALPITTALLSAQLVLFMWAPMNHMAMDVSLGYFILPLSLIVAGRFAFGERLTRLQTWAAGFGAMGIGNELWHTGGVSWPALVINLGYPVYFVLRRKLHINHLGALWLEIVLALPVAIYWVWPGLTQGLPLQQYPLLVWGLLALGLISASALICHVLSSRYLPMGLFGLLGYVEPVLLVAVSLLLGERIQNHEWMTFIPIWVAVGLLALEGIQQLRQHNQP